MPQKWASAMSHEQRVRRFHRLAWATLAYTLGVVLWGAYVRATGSGAGCGSHWPTCHGQVIPRDPSVATLVELTHRVTSGLAWVLAIGLAVAAVRVFSAGHAARRAAIAVAVLMSTEALIGAGVVLLEMVADNTSVARAGWMAAHLINTFLLIGALTLTVRQSAPQAPVGGRGAPRPLHLLAVGAVLLTGMSGAVAALGDTLFPASSLGEALRQDLSPAAHLFVRLRVLHPFVALGTGALLVYLSGQMAGTRQPDVRRAAVATLALTSTQILLGFVNVLLLAPVWMQVVHLLFADLTWIALVWLVDAARPVTAPRSTPAGLRAQSAPGPTAAPGLQPAPSPTAPSTAPR
jgi:heme a synthase